ncbi:MAG: hypothetical protein DMF69_18150 [Acidobacteria bacterium]|nr:MAG: hypothetical protein DMF69_18150 [Acidobacteriota bacterium]
MLRVVVGVVVGLGYGVLVGGVMFLLDDRDHSGALILDYSELFRFLTLLAMIISGSAGALVGLIVTIFIVGKIKAGIIGFSIGLVVIAGVLFTMRMYADVPWHDRGGLFLLFFMLMIMFPMGLAAVGATAVAAAGKVGSKLNSQPTNTRLERTRR